MEKLFVFGDFNWLQEPEFIGELCYEKLRGSDSYAFKFDNDWLNLHAGIKLSEDINNYPGMQYTLPGNDIFGCFADALPDRWGRTLLKRREQLQAEEEQRLHVTCLLSITWWVLMISPEWVVSGLRKKRTGGSSMFLLL